MTIKEILGNQEYYMEFIHERIPCTISTPVQTGLFNKTRIKKQKTFQIHNKYSVYLENSVSPVYPVLTVELTCILREYDDRKYKITIDNKPVKADASVAAAFYKEAESLYSAKMEQKRLEQEAKAKADLETAKQPVYKELQNAVRNLVR